MRQGLAQELGDAADLLIGHDLGVGDAGGIVDGHMDELPTGALGVSYYKESDRLLTIGEPATRAIVGGTGKYVGVDGEVTTVRNEDGSYTHTLRIR